mgnify:CR=1 FL=1
MNTPPIVIPTGGSLQAARSGGIWLRTERMSQLRPDLSTSLRLAQGDKRGRGYAFTLIELLVVISVIALLMAILIPALHRARNQGRAVACQSNLRQWAMTLAAYTEAHEGRFPSDRTGHSALWVLRGTFIGDTDPNADRAALHGFGTKGIALCPMATRPSVDGIRGRFSEVFIASGAVRGVRIEGYAGWPTEAWKVLTPTPPFIGSYGYNHALFCGFRAETIFGPEGPMKTLPNLNAFSMREHTSVPVMLDATAPVSNWSMTDPGALTPMWRTGTAGGLNMFLMDRHGRSVNGMFLDWSVRRVGLKELYTLKWASDFDRTNRWTKAGGVQPDDWPKWMRECKDY